MASKDTADIGTRERIIIAAAEMVSEDPRARLSVRAVAARAGISTGSLRYHFPTQRELQDTVLQTIYEVVAPDDRIRDRSLPARDRLVGCLRNILAPAGVGQEARDGWAIVFRTFIEPDPTDESDSAYQALWREAQHRVEYWLSVLAEEGVMPAGDPSARARFLMTVVNGLSIERALPAEDSLLAEETATLYLAVDAVLASPPS
ncbi:TetR/AcrR family transcriptional regulator [Citricoccus sp.]|uniref:TetR/AcrR family transcriptional regulator n=1 Tax=Citricoccus sp. TaxID=1978372 RepID=UPI0028BDC64E|nr:TetR/AcrR family transcriptional regulator [Citricoccus sp.]